VTPMHLFVLGATGRTGRELVAQALQRGHCVTAFVRRPEQSGAPRGGLTMVWGDLLNAEAVGAAMAGHDAVLSAIGPLGLGRTTITRDSVRATLAAMKAVGVRRLLVVGVAALFGDAGLLAGLLRKTFLRNVASDSAAMEWAVKASDLDRTIARAPRLTNGPLTERYDVADDHLPPGAGGTAMISRADLAHFLLDEVEHPTHTRCVVGIAAAKRRRSY
jgi:putative NADH-flavin reductase